MNLYLSIRTPSVGFSVIPNSYSIGFGVMDMGITRNLSGIILGVGRLSRVTDRNLYLNVSTEFHIGISETEDLEFFETEVRGPFAGDYAFHGARTRYPSFFQISGGIEHFFGQNPSGLSVSLKAGYSFISSDFEWEANVGGESVCADPHVIILTCSEPFRSIKAENLRYIWKSLGGFFIRVGVQLSG